MVTNPNLFPGQYVSEINSALVLGANDTDLFRIEQSIKDTAIVKGLNRTSALQQSTLCAANTTGTSSMFDKAIANLPFVVKEAYCKEDLAGTNYASQMAAGYSNTDFPEEVIVAMVRQIAAEEAFALARIRWSGDTTSADAVLALQNGIVAQLAAAGTSIVVPTPVAITAANVVDEINRLLSLTPARVRRSAGFKLVVSPEIASALEAAAASTVGVLNQMPLLTDANQNNNLDFLGYLVNGRIPVYIATGLAVDNAGVMLAGSFDNSRQGNLVMVTDALTDFSSVLVQDRQAVLIAQPFYDIVMNVRHGVGVMRPEEVVTYAI